LLGGINSYAYGPNPITWVDPYGLSCKEGAAGLMAAAALSSTLIASAPLQVSASTSPVSHGGLPSLPSASDDHFAGFLWNRILDGSVRDDIFGAIGAYVKIGAGSITMVGGWALKKFNPTVAGYMMLDGSSIYAGGVGDFSNQLYGTSYDADFMKHAFRDATTFYGGTESQGDIARAGASLLTIAGAWTTSIPTVVAGGEWGTSALTHTRTVKAVTKASRAEVANDVWTAKDAFKTFAPDDGSKQE